MISLETLFIDRYSQVEDYFFIRNSIIGNFSIINSQISVLHITEEKTHHVPFS